nr:lys-63-specific deubiquitinase BRCC36-like [Ipomoea batatas]GMD37309.1 lys-63-specific deubiquitinase BRCC36-like [Ipomoea batatas]
MSLTSVKMTEEVWLTCLTHALSTETEEIMGLLLGDIQHSKNGSVTALIWGALPQPRCDRRKDRVETNPEQLTAASVQAERMTVATGRTTRVIGWYHSHPHITVLPSHVGMLLSNTSAFALICHGETFLSILHVIW